MISPETPLPPLPYPVYFVLREVESWAALLDGSHPPSVDDIADRIVNAADAWIVQSYIQLRRRGLDVRFVDQFVANQICVVAARQLKLSDLPYSCFLVVCRHDRSRPEVAMKRIVQNRENVVDASDHYLPHWPQPGLLPRDASRGDRIETLTYKGLEMYLAWPFRSDAFRSELLKLGVTLVVGGADHFSRTHDWRDYHACDLVLAVRNITAYDQSIKPPTKLINAWHAGTPALLGQESAYQQIRESDLDFIEILTPEQAIESIRRLQADPALYRAMVDHGRTRANQFTPDAVSREWRDLLAGPLATGYEQWKSAGLLRRTIGRPVQFAMQAIRHRREKRRHRHDVFNGPRPFPEKPGA